MLTQEGCRCMSDNIFAEKETMVVTYLLRGGKRSLISTQISRPTLHYLPRRVLIFRKRNNCQFHFAQYPALAKSEKISLQFCLAVTGLSADAFFKYITDVVIRCKVDGKKFAAMSFDRTSSMKFWQQN